METQKIFITGCAGFLGSHLSDLLAKRGHEVVGCDNMVGGYEDNIPKDIEFYKADCNDLKRMTEITKGCDIMFHCAALAHENFSIFSPKIITENVFLATSSMLTASIASNVRRFVLCSSMSRYGENEIPFREDMIPNPKSPYGIAKHAAELLTESMAETYGMEYVVAVPHNIIGPKQKYDDPFRNVASIFINLMLQGRQPIIYGDGNQKRCFSFVGDVLPCLEKMAFDKKLAGETINIGPDEEFVTVNKLAEMTAELLNFDLNPVYVPGSPLEVKFATCSADKARTLLGYKTKYTLKQGLKEVIEYIKNRGPRPFQYHLPLEIVNEKTPPTWKDRLL